ncbi:SDR family oxidoreductase [Neolewinella lacunae]|uniref:Peroxisomal trans-2-enoyl-CoA reductase n=1 Tax=Neolewinella lacunae TaxID=1517758 RepID=A0A923PLD2_9BACT|nr:SDR family oxidoreductase [Neolewinella lacunae]MBC6993424.1 SDR family oxidoreductase [Neolewinella lacunae]MDN3636300.1 SDR family oxidoreductase [Neolewinella lacunae]
MYAPDLFKGQVALVTGGRSGIGYGIAEHLLRLGASVVICARKAGPLAEAAERLSGLGTCLHQPCDIRQSAEVEALADLIADRFGRLDILVNNAGGQFPSLARYFSDNGWNAVINTNVNGTFYVTRTMANRFFIPQQAGNVVNIIVNLHRGFPGMAHTGAARAAVENLTKSLAQEWAIHNIRMNCVAPGTILSSGLDTYAEPVRELLDEMKDDNLMRRHGTIEDVSNAVLFLASPLSAYTSGVTLYVDGMDHLHSNRMRLVDKFR